MKHVKSFYALFESESFDHKKADLKADYKMLNDKLFNGELTEVPLRWMDTKYKLGVVAFTQEGKGNIEYLGISTFYDISHQKYLNVLAHEMIHVYMVQKKIQEKDPHGRKFMEILERINKENPEFNLVKSNDAKDFKVKPGKTSKTKTYGVVLFEMDGEMSIVAVNADVVNDVNQITPFLDYMKKNVVSVFLRNRTVNIEIYLSDHPDIPSFKIKRNLSLRALQLYVLTKEKAKEIQDTGKLIVKEKIK